MSTFIITFCICVHSLPETAHWDFSLHSYLLISHDLKYIYNFPILPAKMGNLNIFTHISSAAALIALTTWLFCM